MLIVTLLRDIGPQYDEHIYSRMQITLTDHAVIFNQRAYVVYLQKKRRKGADRYVHRRFELKALKRTLNQKLCKLMKVFTTPPLHPEAPYLMDPAD